MGEGEGLAALARRRAEWARHVNEPRAAAEMYLAAGDVQKAAQLMAESGRRDMYVNKVEKSLHRLQKHTEQIVIRLDFIQNFIQKCKIFRLEYKFRLLDAFPPKLKSE